MPTSLSRPKRIVLISLGCITFSLGIVGIFLPLLPTTVFLLISAWAWMKSSDRFYHWLINNRVLGSYIRNYREERGITMRQKILTLTLLWVAIGYAALIIVEKLWLTLLLFGIAIGVTIHLLTLKTLNAKKADP